ncbi:alpha/beta fold hydrolase [Rhizobium sp. BK176]|uniref:alpha/beta fold hydrolase n=1 Tax=Rhizobium sp. BK176 TaxID=2587071 RepID=UPI0021680313|nr:alpha/beta hydrolase [Rhizobium sp. BK176]MCS4096468.1 pimeloyl-ACP methyl ester carboxylesterase [Rhizobium sp. BK176]
MAAILNRSKELGQRELGHSDRLCRPQSPQPIRMPNRHIIVLVPGLTRSSFHEVFAPQLEGLAGLCEFCAPEFNGRNEIKKASALVREMIGTDRFALCAFSDGAAVAFELMRQVPEQITHVSLVSACVPHSPVRSNFGGRFLFSHHRTSPGSAMRPNQSSTYACTQQPEPVEERADGLKAAFIDAERTFKGKVLFLSGDRDKISPYQGQARLASLFARSEFHLMIGVGHFATLEAPATVNRTIRRHLTS